MNLFDRAFYGCVRLLNVMADAIDPWVPGGMNYVKINVILFCVLLPLVLAGLVVALVLK